MIRRTARSVPRELGRAPLLALALIAACSAAALSVSACGGDEPVDPAALAPADSALYVEAVVRPQGSQRDRTVAAISRLTGRDDVDDFLVEQLEAALAREGSGVSFAEDIEPWLGERAALFVSGIDEHGEGEGAVVIEAADSDAAHDALDRLAGEAEDVGSASYRGVEYFSDGDDAAGVVDDFVVAGHESGFRAAVDTERGELDSLAGAGSFEAVSELSDDPIASVLADLPAMFDAAEASGDLEPAERRAFETVLPGVADDVFAATLAVTDQTLELEASVAAEQGADSLEETELLGGLPSGAWLAVGAPDLGAALRRLVEAGARQEGIEPSRLNRAFERQTGASLDRTLGSIGDAAGFAAGESLFAVDAGAVAAVADREAVASGLEAVRRQIRRDGGRTEPLESDDEGFAIGVDAPEPVSLALRGERLALVYGGADAIDAALAPDSTLEDSPAFEAADEALGGDYAAVAFADFEPLAQLVSGIPTAVDPGLGRLRDALDGVDFSIAGVRRSGDRQVARVVVGLAAEGG